MFQLTRDEAAKLTAQTMNSERASTRTRRNIAARPYAFTEQGVAMLSSVLRSKRAIAVNIEIMRTFVRLRQMIATHADLARKLAALERKYDDQFKVIFEAIRELMSPEPLDDPAREIGFHTTLTKTRPAKSKG